MYQTYSQSNKHSVSCPIKMNCVSCLHRLLHNRLHLYKYHSTMVHYCSVARLLSKKIHSKQGLDDYVVKGHCKGRIGRNVLPTVGSCRNHHFLIECYVHEIEGLYFRTLRIVLIAARRRKIHRTLLLALIHPQTIFCHQNAQIVDKSTT